jgi:sigma-B regulation protein RsbU (phosphoserine phosphatase)
MNERLRRLRGSPASLKGRIALSFFVAMLALLLVMLGIQISTDRNDARKLREARLEQLQASWRTALKSNGTSAARQVPTLKALASDGLHGGGETSLISRETREIYHRVDLMSADGTIRQSSTRPRPVASLADPGVIATRLRFESALSSLVMFDDGDDQLPGILVALRASRDAYLVAVRSLSAVTPLLSTGIAGHWMIHAPDGKLLATDLPQEVATHLLQQVSVAGEIADLELDGRVYQLTAIPLDDLQSRRVATLTGIIDVTETRLEDRHALFIALASGLGLILLTTFLLYQQLDAQFRPLGELSTIIQQVADGKLYGSTRIRGSASELRQIARAITVLQGNAIEAEHQRFSAGVRQTANLLLIESEMDRLRQTLGAAAQRTLEAQLAREAEGPDRLARAFRIMIDQVISQQTRLTELLDERERDLSVVRQALAERGQLTRLREELEIARQLQLSNLPGEEAIQALSARLDLYASMRPAQEVGGDFYDFALLDDRYLVLLIGDASGKGVPAAMFGMMARILMKASASQHTDPGQCLALANRALATENNALLFATAFLGVLDLATGRLRYASAGHNPPLVLRTSGALMRLDEECGLVLGAMDDSSYPTHEHQLATDDLLVLYTDGITEAHNAAQQLYGEQRLATLLSTVPPGDARDAAQAIFTSVDHFTGKATQFDDMTLTIVRYQPAG